MQEVGSSDFPGREVLQQSLQKLEKSLEEACRERDKAKKELNRLKQHLLDKVAWQMSFLFLILAF